MANDFLYLQAIPETEAPFVPWIRWQGGIRSSKLGPEDVSLSWKRRWVG